MFDELKKYKLQDHFFFKPDSRLAKVCNAPTDCSGVYLVYALSHGNVELIYIGRSGKEGPDGKIKHRKDGLKGRFLTGKQFGNLRQKTWPEQMKREEIEALDIYWYVTHGDHDNDFPDDIEDMLLGRYSAIYGRLPRWNRRG